MGDWSMGGWVVNGWLRIVDEMLVIGGRKSIEVVGRRLVDEWIESDCRRLVVIWGLVDGQVFDARMDSWRSLWRDGRGS